MLRDVINTVINKTQPSKVFLAFHFQGDRSTTLGGWVFFSTSPFTYLTELYVIHKWNVRRHKSQTPQGSDTTCTSGHGSWEACRAGTWLRRASSIPPPRTAGLELRDGHMVGHDQNTAISRPFNQNGRAFSRNVENVSLNFSEIMPKY